MKKIILSLAIALPFWAGAQSLELYNESDELVNNDTLIINSNTDSTLIEVPVTVKNISANPIDVKVAKTEVTLVTGSEAYYCWDNCYPPDTDTSNVVTIGSNETTELFSGDYKPKGIAGESLIKYLFFNDRNSEDTAVVYIKYIIELPTAIDNLNWDSPLTVSDPYPNPAISYVIFDYSVNSFEENRFELYNIIGEKVRDLPLPIENNQIRIDLENLPNGLYIYSFKSGNKAIKDGRILVK